MQAVTRIAPRWNPGPKAAGKVAPGLFGFCKWFRSEQLVCRDQRSCSWGWTRSLKKDRCVLRHHIGRTTTIGREFHWGSLPFCLHIKRWMNMRTPVSHPALKVSAVRPFRDAAKELLSHSSARWCCSGALLPILVSRFNDTAVVCAITKTTCQGNAGYPVPKKTTSPQHSLTPFAPSRCQSNQQSEAICWRLWSVAKTSQ